MPNFHPSAGAGAKMSKMILQGVLSSEKISGSRKTITAATAAYHHAKSKSNGVSGMSASQAQQLIEQASGKTHTRKTSAGIKGYNPSG